MTTNELTIHIEQDNDTESPRTWGRAGHLLAMHRNYNLGDADAYDYLDHEPKYYLGWYEIEAELERKRMHYAPVYMLDHSGIRLSTKDFNDRWDSGRVGFIFLTREEALEIVGGTKMSPAKNRTIDEYLRQEIAVLDQYVDNDVWTYRITDSEGNELDACSGMYGYDYCEETANQVAAELQTQAAKETADGKK